MRNCLFLTFVMVLVSGVLGVGVSQPAWCQESEAPTDESPSSGDPMPTMGDDEAFSPGETPPVPEPDSLPENATTETPLKLTVTDKWSVLVTPARPRPGVVEFTEKSPIQNITEFRLLGPMVGHPFGLGEYIVDGRMAVAQGAVQLVEGKNALLSLAVADQFEMEGIISQEKLGGWLMLIGWNQGHGYSVSNVTMKDSGAPWFICEYRAAEAITATNNEVKQFEWRDNQPFRVIVKEKQLTIGVGKTMVVENYPLENYSPGQIMLGTYDTRYGPRPLQIKSLRIRALLDQPAKGKKTSKSAVPKKSKNSAKKQEDE